MTDKAPRTHADTHALPLPSPTFCALPWLQLYADPLGRVRGCPLAYGDGAEAPALIHGPGGIEAAWNSSLMRGMRRDMLAGRRPDACALCFRDEDMGVHYYRHGYNRLFQDHIAEAAAATAEDGSAPIGLVRKIDFYLGNSCNLRCRMCSPLSSRALLAEWAEIKGLSPRDPSLEPLRSIDWFTRAEFRQAIDAVLPNVERLHFAGGEPFLIPQMFEVLERVIELGHAMRVTLSYNSNFTTLPNRLFDFWRHFKAVRLTVSLDGVGPVNDLIRAPSVWADIDRNLHTIDREFERVNVASLSMNVTVQVYNALRIDELIAYAADSFAHMDAPNLSLLSAPEALNVQILPPDLKEEAAARLRRCLERFEGRWPERWSTAQIDHLRHAANGIVEHMMAADRRDLLPEFRRLCAIQDRRRNQDTAQALPELAPLFA
ncbi:twitch domain-containing radical SAM protein [Azospirillum sp. sgz302134]